MVTDKLTPSVYIQQSRCSTATLIALSYQSSHDNPYLDNLHALSSRSIVGLSPHLHKTEKKQRVNKEARSRSGFERQTGQAGFSFLNRTAMQRKRCESKSALPSHARTHTLTHTRTHARLHTQERERARGRDFGQTQHAQSC